MKTKNDNGALCPYLWNHHCVMPTGLVNPCCRVDHSEITAWRDTAKIADGIYSPAHVKAREQMRKGERPEICKVCWDLEDKGLESERVKALRKVNAGQTQVDFDAEPKHVESIDIKFNNTCNLACRMCYPGSSSLINSLITDIPQKQRFNNQKKHLISPKFYEDEKLEIIKKHISEGATSFKTTGGDPFFQQHFFELIDWCIQKNYNKSLEIKLTTNLIGMNPKLLSQLRKFKKVELTVSIDGYGDVYEYIRYPASWKKLVKNLKLCLIEFKNNSSFEVYISILLQSYNIFNINILYDYLLNKLGCSKEQIFVDCQLKPIGKSEIAVENLPAHLIQQAINESVIPKVTEFYKSLNPTETGNIKMLKLFSEKTLVYDKQRNQDYRVLDKRIIHLIETCKKH